MKIKILILIGLCCIAATTGGPINGQPQGSDKNKVGDNISFNSLSKIEIEMLLADVAKTNPMIVKRLAEDPEMKKQQIENLRQLLAFASQAQKDGFASDPTNKQEMENIRAEILAVNYDREINRDKGKMPAFGFITDDQVKAYWGEKIAIGPAGRTERRTHEAEFNDFLKAKIEVLNAGSPEMKDRVITAAETIQARDMFARIRIYWAEYDRKAKSGALSTSFIEKINLQVKLQQAQFLARLYSNSERVNAQLKATDEDIAKYIALYPGLDPTPKRSKAQGILDRAKAGEDFAALANEFTEDPGNKGADGIPQGGFYRDVPKGLMVVPFETAALALQPGKVASELVETDFGFHIIKLERQLEAKKKAGKETYDVRHILVSTGIKDPDNPAARGQPLKDYVRQKLEIENENKLVTKLVADNDIRVPLDFDVPDVGVEQAPKPVIKRPVQRKRRVKKHR